MNLQVDAIQKRKRLSAVAVEGSSRFNLKKTRVKVFGFRVKGLGFRVLVQGFHFMIWVLVVGGFRYAACV